MATSTQELLDAVNSAIAGSLDGIEEYEYNGRRVKRMNPNELFKVRGKLMAQLDREQNGGMFRVARFGGNC